MPSASFGNLPFLACVVLPFFFRIAPVRFVDVYVIANFSFNGKANSLETLAEKFASVPLPTRFPSMHGSFFVVSESAKDHGASAPGPRA